MKAGKIKHENNGAIIISIGSFDSVQSFVFWVTDRDSIN